MKTHSANVMLRVSGALSPRQKADLQRAVGEQPGVSRTLNPARGERLMLVHYDPQVITAQQILGTITARGHGACLIGL